jgi:sugar (pentulose or hexulose) kinase
MGFDLGTQSVRAMVVTDAGKVLGAAGRALTSSRNGPMHEQDPQQWWRELCAASREALRDVPRSLVGGVAVAATSGTVLLARRDGTPLTPALMYDDRRASAEVERVNEVGASLWSRLGYQSMQPTWALPKLLWLLREHAAALPGARLAHQNDFVNRRLVGRDVPTDLSNALKTGVDLMEETWPAQVLAELGVPGHVLPGVVRPGTELGTVCADAAAATGIPERTPVIAGTTDGCAAQIGAGAMRAGDWNTVLGTTLVLKGVSQELIHDPLGVVYSHRAPDGAWLPGGASSTGAGVLARDLAGRDLDELGRQASRRTGVTATTYPLVSRGERFPFRAPRAEGFTLGSPADDVERYAAILRGTAFIERLCFDYLDLLGAPVDGGEVVLTGGATRSPHWTQLRADVLRRPVTLRENAEPALGMAVLAAAVGRQVSEVAGEMVRTRDIVTPRAACGNDLDGDYLRLVGELNDRGWLADKAAAHARERTAR